MTTVTDITTGDVLAGEASMAESAWARFRGWMLRSRPHEGEGIVIRPCGSIHMMFMRFPIDAVFFDRDHRVTHVTRRLPPWVGLAFGRRGAYGVVELPVGAGAGVEKGHQLSFDP